MSVLYAVMIELLGWFYEVMTIKFINNYNYRYTKDYNDALSLQLFCFNFINYYVPLGFVAFMKQKFNALFTILIIVLVIEQGKVNLERYLTPICCYRGGIKKKEKEWREKLKIEVDKKTHEEFYREIPTKRDKI